MRFYLAGAMRGQPRWNFPAFDAARDFLVSLGHDVISPADIDRAVGIDEDTVELPLNYVRNALRRDFAEIVGCDAIAFLPGWEASYGARAERQVGAYVGCQFWRVDPEARTLVREFLVGLAGYAGAGKDEAAKALYADGFVRAAFADAIRATLYAVNPLVRLDRTEEIADPYYAPLAELVDAYGWSSVKRQTMVRQLLQRVGTEAGRGVLGDHVWVDAVLRVPPGPRVVLTDCRFPEEADAIRSRGGIVIRIERPGVGPINSHASELALDDYEFDTVIQNDDSPEQLGIRVLHAVRGFIG
jgi:hypothetical protein